MTTTTINQAASPAPMKVATATLPTAAAHAAPLANPKSVRIKFRNLKIVWENNVRKTYTPEWIEKLGQSLKEDGQKRDLDVAEPDAEGMYELLGGYSRCKAFMLIYGKDVGDIMVDVRVHPNKRAGVPLTAEEKMQINLASDEQQMPVKRSELAERVTYMVQEIGIKQQVVAKKCMVDAATVSELVKCWTKLEPRIKEAWKKAPTRQLEIPLSVLTQWAKFPFDAQMEAFDRYMSPPSESDAEDEDELGDGGDNEDEQKEKGSKEIFWKVRSKKEIKNRLDELLAMRKEGSLTELQEHSIKELRWVLNDLKKAPA